MGSSDRFEHRLRPAPVQSTLSELRLFLLVHIPLSGVEQEGRGLDCNITSTQT